MRIGKGVATCRLQDIEGGLRVVLKMLMNPLTRKLVNELTSLVHGFVHTIHEVIIDSSIGCFL